MIFDIYSLVPYIRIFSFGEMNLRIVIIRHVIFKMVFCNEF